MGATWVLSAPSGPHVGPMSLAIRDTTRLISRELYKLVARRGSGCFVQLVRQHGPRSKPLDHIQWSVHVSSTSDPRRFHDWSTSVPRLIHVSSTTRQTQWRPGDGQFNYQLTLSLDPCVNQVQRVLLKQPRVRISHRKLITSSRKCRNDSISTIISLIKVSYLHGYNLAINVICTTKEVWS